MSNPRHRLLATAIAPLALIALAPSAASAATAFYGVTNDGHLAQFTSDNTSTAATLPIRGLAAGDKVIGLDIRPADGRLYGLTSASRIVVFNPRNAQVTYVGDKAIDPALNSAKAGFDFNPTVDRIRVETDAAQNLRIDPRTGQLATTTVTPTPAPTTPENTTPTTPQPTTTPGKPDGNIAYVAGDPGAGTAPKVTAAAYTNSFPIGSTTELFVLDSARGVLAKQDPANDGTLKTVGSLNRAGETPIAFDIAEGNAGYAALGNASGTQARLYRVNLQTGAATATGAVNVVGTRSPLVALASAGTIDDDTARPRLSVSSSSTQLASRLLSGGVQLTVNTNEAVSGTARVKYNNRTVGTADVSVDGGAGFDRVVVSLNSTARNAIRRPQGALITLSVDVSDGAGNRSTISRPIRTR